jgi:hypothetical protein
MEMQGGAYRIYGGEIDPVLRRIQNHDCLVAIEATACPCCGSALRVLFYPDGRLFQVLCAGQPPHISTLQDIESPPPWWCERIVQPVESIVTLFRVSETGDAGCSPTREPTGDLRHEQ